jgi:hypothetical protein
MELLRKSLVKLRRRTPQQSWRAMPGATAHQHRLPVFNARSQTVLDFMNSMIYSRQFLALLDIVFSNLVAVSCS